MKKNAILVAGILVVAGCAHPRGGYGNASLESGSSSDMSSQYSSASSPEVITRDSEGRMVAVDSSVSDHSSDNTPQSQYASSGGFAKTDDIRADSSIRGGSPEARGYIRSTNPQEPSSGSMQHRYAADSSVRGGSMEAHGWSNQSAMDQNQEQSRADSGAYGTYENNFNSSLAENQQSNLKSSQDSDLAQGGFDAVVVGEGSSKDNANLSGRPMVGTGEKSAGPELNSSKKLEKDISGNYQVPAEHSSSSTQEQSSNSNQEGASGLSAEAGVSAGEPSASSSTIQNHVPASPSQAEERNSGREPQNRDAAVLSGAVEQTPSELKSEGNSAVAGSLSSDSTPQSQVGLTSEQPNPLFKNNRAQGIGSAATGETGASAGNISANASVDQLANKVKSVLTKESTGTHGMLRSEIARNIKVTSNGGQITLKGSVPTQQDKDIVGIRAAEVTGVTKVDNQLTVSPQSDPANRDLSKGHDLEEQTDQNLK